MREGCYEVVLVDQDGHKLDEVMINGQFYIVAIPGKEYVIKIIVHEDLATHSYPAESMRVGLYVDGVDVQYWKRLDLSLISERGGQLAASSSVHTIFHGFKKSNNDLRSFVFAKTLATSFPSSSTDHINNSSFGTIKVVIYEAIQVEGVYQNVGGKYEVPGQHSVNVDGKFYKQPSVTTMAGRNIAETEKFIPLLRWQNKSDIPLTTLSLFYHTHEMIRFLRLFHETSSPGEQPSSLEQSERGKRKYQEIVDLTDDSTASAPSTSVASPSLSLPSTTVLTALKSHIISSSSSSPASSFTAPTYTISSSECASDEVEVLTVVKEIPMFDLTAAAPVDGEEEQRE